MGSILIAHKLCFLPTAANGTSGVKVSDVLCFCSGTDRVPPLGFGGLPSVKFIPPLNEERKPLRLAKASTCSIVLYLPTYHGTNYNSFCDALIQSLKENDGFGEV